MSYGDVAERAARFAHALAESGMAPGDRILLAVPNCPATVVAGLAAHAIGATAVEVNRDWGAEVLADVVARSAVKQAVIAGRDLGVWAKVCASTPLDRLWVVHPGKPPQKLLQDLSSVRWNLVLDDGTLGAKPPDALLRRSRIEIRREWPALILYTSGSTGRPRGVVQTFANIEANTRSIVQYLELTSSDRALLVLPLYYCYGRSVLQTHLFVGGSVFLDNRFAFPRTVLEALAAEGCTGFAGVPLTFEIIRRQVDVSALSFPRLRYLTQAGGAMAPETIDWARKAFHPARLFVMYGQTEATSRLSYLPPERAAEKPGSIGIPIPAVELAVLNDSGHRLPAGEIGHLVARGGNVMLGYLNEPEETARTLRDGWLWTGDLAYYDAEGFFFHCGRSKEILKIGGYRVSPVEIEQCLAKHPSVVETAVVGMPDSLMGEVAAAFVVLRAGASTSETELQKFCRERMAPYRVPAIVRFVDRLPRNEAGKLLRPQLAQQARDSAST